MQKDGWHIAYGAAHEEANKQGNASFLGNPVEKALDNYGGLTQVYLLSPSHCAYYIH